MHLTNNSFIFKLLIGVITHNECIYYCEQVRVNPLHHRNKLDTVIKAFFFQEYNPRSAATGYQRYQSMDDDR